MKTRHETELEAIKEEITLGEYMDDEISYALGELDSYCCSIIEKIFALRGIKISNDQADALLSAIGNDSAVSSRRFLEKSHQLLEFSKVELKNLLNFEKEFAIKFFNEDE